MSKPKLPNHLLGTKRKASLFLCGRANVYHYPSMHDESDVKINVIKEHLQDTMPLRADPKNETNKTNTNTHTNK